MSFCNSFCNSLHKELNEFRLDGSYCDVTFQIEGKTFQCHRVVLASSCEYFKCLFGSNFREACSSVNDITLLNIDAISFNILLEFIYLGRKPIFDVNNIYGLLRSSDFLQLQAVKNLCVEYILYHASSFSSACVFELFHLACGLNDHLMMDTLSKYCVVYLEDFVQKDFFLEISFNCLSLVLKQHRLSSVNFNNENFLLDAVVRWVFFSFDERQKFFQNLINTVNFGKITKDCLQFLLREYKTNCKMNLGCDQYTDAALKTFLFDAFSLNKFVNDEDTMPISYEDSSLETTPSIHIYTQRFYQKDQGNDHTYFHTIWSLNEPDSCQAGDSQDLSNLSSMNNNRAVKPNWAISCTFSMDDSGFTLASSKKSNHIYCLSNYGKMFRAYNTVDLSSNQYIELSPFKACIRLGMGEVETCGSDDGNIYFYERSTSEIFSYNCNVDEWFPISGLKTEVQDFHCVAHNNMLYVIEGTVKGENSEEQVLKEYIQAYDYCTPRWLELSRSKTEISSSSSYRNYSSTSCVANGKIYNYNGENFRVFEPVAGNWMDINFDQWNIHTTALWPGCDFDKFRLIPCREQLFVFGSNSAEYLIYNYTTNTLKDSVFYDYCSIVGYQELVDVIAVADLQGHDMGIFPLQRDQRKRKYGEKDVKKTDKNKKSG